MGLSSLRFFSVSFRGGKGGTAPEAFPTDTSVPLRFKTLKFPSNLSTILYSRIYRQFKSVNSRIFPDAVKHSIHALPVRDFQHPRHRVLLRVQYNVVRPVLRRDRRLLLRGGRPDDRRPARVRDLREDEPEPAGDGVHEDGLARLHVVRLAHHRQRGQRRRGEEVDGGREREDLVPGHGDVLCHRALVALDGICRSTLHSIG